MLKIVIPEDTFFNENTNEFIEVKRTELQLEHSLISLKKWESRWHKPFLGKRGVIKEELTNEEILDYIRCMTITQNVDPFLYNFIPDTEFERVFSYINDSMTATWFSEDSNGQASFNRKSITAEVIYYWMIKLNIPVEFQKWHLNQLITLIRVINAEEAPQKKMSKEEILARNRSLNAQRRAKAKRPKG